MIFTYYDITYMILNVSTGITFVSLQIPPTRSLIRYKIWTFIKKSKNFRYIRNGYYASNDKISLETLTTFSSKQRNKKKREGKYTSARRKFKFKFENNGTGTNVAGNLSSRREFSMNDNAQV